MNKKLNSEIGSRILDLRRNKKLTREQLSEKAEISTQFLADIESGKKGMSAATLYKICLALCVSADYLLFGYIENKSRIAEIISSLPEKQRASAEKILSAFVEALEC